MGTFSQFEHTADVGLVVRGRDLADLLETAARAVFAQMLDDLPTEVAATDEVRAAPGPGLEGDVAELLVVWLQELLFRFDTERLVPLAFDFARADPAGARATVRFGRFDPGRHRARLDVKAVTYHGLEVCEEPGGGWRARLVLDV